MFRRELPDRFAAQLFVFSDDIFNATFTAAKDNDGRSINLVAAVSNTASHEAGHAFGLEHLAKYVKGKKVDDYDGGTAEWTPIMGDNLASDRTTWGYGPTAAGPKAFQNDVQILSSTLGLRPDDHSNSRFNATPLIGSNLTAATPKTGKGIIEWQADVDLFKFTATGGPIKVQVKAAEFGPNMWVKAQLWNETGFVAAGVSGLSNFQSIVSASVPAGNYYVVVQGNGGYGHLGQYTVQVTQETPVSKGPVVKGVDVVGPIGPVTPTKTKSTTTKSAKMASAQTAGVSANDGNSNDAYFASTATLRSLPPVGIRNTTKSVPHSRSLSNSLKDAAFDSLFSESSRI